MKIALIAIIALVSGCASTSTATYPQVPSDKLVRLTESFVGSKVEVAAKVRSKPHSISKDEINFLASNEGMNMVVLADIEFDDEVLRFMDGEGVLIRGVVVGRGPVENSITIRLDSIRRAK